MNARCLTRVARAGVTMALLAALSSCSESKNELPHAPDAAPAEARTDAVPSERDELLPCEVAGSCPPGLAGQRPFTIAPARTACSDWTNGSANSRAHTKYVDLTSVDPEAVKQATRLCTSRQSGHLSACVGAVLAVRPREPSAAQAWDCDYGEGPEQPSELDAWESCEAESTPDACE